MKRFIPLIITIFIFNIITGQESESPDWGIKFTGFVNNDFIWDSRQTVSARQGHFLLWPAPEKLDPNNNDINARANFNILSIRTRLKGTISGPDVFGAKSSAVIEGSFFGHSNADLNEFRLRHAFAKLNWEHTELIAGQNWHPMFIAACFPATLNFNTGVPFQPFSRNPQIRITQDLGPIKASITALTHLDFTSAAGAVALRNSGLPEVHLQAWYANAPSAGQAGILIGGGAGVKKLVPMIETDSGYSTNAGVSSYMFELYSKLSFSKFTIKAEGSYGQNNYDLLMLGSYAVTFMDPVTGEMKYTPTTSYSAWIDILSNNPTWQPGIFAGFTKNIGAGEDILSGSVAGSRGNIDFVYRVSPRLIYNTGKMRFGLELDYTAAAFGTMDSKAGVTDSSVEGNFRALLSVFYFF
jgi:hypothetical protein